MNYKIILNIIGRIMWVEAAFMLPALLISAVKGEQSSAVGFGVAILLLAAVGFLFSRKSPPSRRFYAREGFVTVGLAWIVVSLFGALPFFISGAIPSFVDCVFETVSGFTTTGASILSEIESLPMGILYWRSFTHWLGGMGVLVFVLAIVPLSKETGYSMHLFRAESPGVTVDKLVPRVHRSAMILYKIYIALTLLEMVSLLICRMPLFDSITTTFGTAGTGGFSIKNDSIASYNNDAQTVITIFMILFGINFNVFFLLILKEFKRALKREELWFYLGVIIAAITLITINTASMFDSLPEALHHVAFQVASIISTTGFSTVDFDKWPEFSRAVLLLLMFFGSCAGSTGGGIKAVRAVVLFKSARRAIYKILRPNSVKLIHMDGELVEDNTANSVQSYLVIYVFIVIAVTLLVSIDGFSFETNFSAAMACFNNIGPGLGAIGPSLNYADFSIFSKLVLSLSMLMGRLELFPILILFTASVWKK